MKASVLVSVVFGVTAASAATIPAVAQPEAMATRSFPPAAAIDRAWGGVERREPSSGWFSLLPELLPSIAPVIPKIMSKVGHGISRTTHFVMDTLTGKKGKKGKKGKRDGDYADDGEAHHGEAEGVARRFVA